MNSLRASDLDPRDIYIQHEVALTFQLQRRFREMGAALDRALAIMPEHAATRILQTTVAYQRLGDTRPLRDQVDAMMTANPRVDLQLAEAMVPPRTLGARC